ncbi:hypothetical protein PFY12_04595 [Chryseobacterium camelliae]|uniref:Uncharacterized protein n=1 Tax=Chryseobacterium camelliae TaxID=1265445 RepID=A0ABY7QPY0_9FLAO|nr:hypothetical protein [Chryseobacterium camelliae]WBV61404.1 hypothetical protein PFY12_04595 [Chryseobacterium camelliae]
MGNNERNPIQKSYSIETEDVCIGLKNGWLTIIPNDKTKGMTIHFEHLLKIVHRYLIEGKYYPKGAVGIDYLEFDPNK